LTKIKIKCENDVLRLKPLCNYRFSMLNTDISTNCASNFIQNDRIFKLLLGIRVPKTKDFVENREDRWMDGWMDGYRFLPRMAVRIELLSMRVLRWRS